MVFGTGLIYFVLDRYTMDDFEFTLLVSLAASAGIGLLTIRYGNFLP
jgi:hypothetical protein